jgi:transcriptional regulator with XRE-family HTH domain
MTKEQEIDRAVGARVRMARVEASMSQEALGDRVNLTFQQIQKYEKGTNRVSASRLVQFSLIFKKPIEWFFVGAVPDAGGHVAQPSAIEQLASLASGRALAEAYVAIPEARARSLVLAVAEELASRFQQHLVEDRRKTA